MPNIMRLGGGGESGAKLAATYNEDGTQNLLIADDGTVFDLASLTADADATAEDVAEGKVFYAQGVRRVGAGGGAPVLLWTNASPTSAFAAQNLAISYSQYVYLLIESRATTNGKKTVILINPNASGNFLLSQNTTSSQGYIGIATREVTCSGGKTIAFADAYIYQTSGSSVASGNYAIPLRIWGVKFAL